MADIKFTDKIEIKLMQCTASDASVIAAARASTLGADSVESLTKDPNEAAGLINYLLKNRHGTPFEHNSFTFYVRAPIFVYREWHRHRVGWSYNEESGRYKELLPEFYLPSVERNLVQSGKPGHYEYKPGTKEQYEELAKRLKKSYAEGYEAYKANLDAGIAREVARMCLPVATMSSMYATCNARSLMHFLSLRTEHSDAAFPSHPQREIAMAADQMEAILAEKMPLTYEAYVKNGRVAP